MCCNVLAIGSSRSNDIILKDAVDHHAVLQASSLGEVFLFHHDSKLRTGHYLGHNDMFTVWAKLFKLKYPQDTGLNHPIATDGTSATIRGGKEDQSPVTLESSKPCLTEVPTDYPESSATVTREVSSDDEYDDNVLMDDPESVHNETDDPESVHNETDDSELVQDEMDDPELLRVSKSKPTSKRPALKMTCNLLAKRARNQVKAKESCPGTSSSRNPTSRKSSNSPKKARRIQNLTDEQRRCLRSLFQVNVTMRQELQRIDCINAIQRHKCLSSLDWTKIKKTLCTTG